MIEKRIGPNKIYMKKNPFRNALLEFKKCTAMHLKGAFLNNRALFIGGTLFFCLLPVVVYGLASRPTVGYVSPSSGLALCNQPAYFITTYYDTAGCQDIKQVCFLVNTALNGKNCLYASYSPAANRLYLRNDADTAWLGALAPSTPTRIENSYAVVDCLRTTVTRLGTCIVVRWCVTFKDTFGSKCCSLWLSAESNSGLSTGWVPRGTLVVTGPRLPVLTGSVIINNNAPYTASPIVSLILPVKDSFGGTIAYIAQLSNDGIYWNTSSYSITKRWRLTGTDGKKTVYAKFCDRFGRWTPVYSSSIILDSIPPYGSIKINNDAAYTRQGWVSVGLSCADAASGPGIMQFSNDGMTWSAPEPYLSTRSWQLTNGDGHKTVYVKFKDNAGNWSRAVSDSIILDTTPPTGSITINNGDAYATAATVTVTLSTTDSISGVHAMQFSNDGLNWSTPEPFSTSKVWALDDIEGEKTVYARFIDAAGNISPNYHDSILLYRGTLINPTQGGEVTSPDGKACLIIPPGAFGGDPKSLLLMLKDPLTYENITPNNYKLRLVVECQPQGLIFWKPCRLIVTLDESEVPGTPVELGLILDNSIDLTYESSFIKADGITVEFLINHFSTYAGLSSMLSQGAPIGAGVKIPLPDMFTGAFGHAIPITVPPGRKGMQPNLTLQYRSSNPNGICGVGWSINPGYIVRSTKLGPPSYVDTNDTYIFVTDQGSTELTHLIDNLYQARIESSFAKFYKKTDDSWTVIQKDGIALHFGQTASSKEISSKGTFLWNLTNVTDNNGNYIELTYTKDREKAYIDHIDYTGNKNTAPLNSVEFILEDRNDKASSYISTSQVIIAKRLKEILVKQNDALVWTYSLTYEYSPDTNKSLLISITQSAAGGESFPAQTFTYQGAHD